MGLGGISLWQLLIILVIVVLLFGTKKLSTLGSDLGGAVKGFRKAMKEGVVEKDEPGPVDDRLSELHALRHAGREVPEVPQSLLLETDSPVLGADAGTRNEPAAISTARRMRAACSSLRRVADSPVVPAITRPAVPLSTWKSMSRASAA